MILMIIICYVKWWYQHYLKKAFIKHIEALFKKIWTVQTTLKEE